MRIPLFDIDWTLLDKDKKRNIHWESFLHAFETAYGIKNPKTILAEGKVDNQIILETMKANGISETIARQKIKGAVTAMKDYFSRHKYEGELHAMPGVEELISSLKQIGIPMGLLTGNVEEIAWGKLEKAGIKEFFNFGAFGDQAFKRGDLIELARTQAEKILNRKVNKKEFVIIGDTPLDIACAQQGGVDSIGVASGMYSEDELVSAGADLVVLSLEEKDKILGFLAKN